MTRQRSRQILFSTVLAVLTPLMAIAPTPIARADAPDYTTEWTGTWINTDTNTSNITRFVVTPTGNHKFKVQVYGKCHPTDCAWGNAEMVTYKRSDGYYFYGIANYKMNFKKTTLFFTLAEGPVVLQTFNQFTDRSQRENYYTSDQFQRISL